MKKYVQIFLGIMSIAAINAQELESLIEQAELNNPEIQAYELRYNIASEKINEVKTFPNTEISVGVFASEPETRTGAQKPGIPARVEGLIDFLQDEPLHIPAGPVRKGAGPEPECIRPLSQFQPTQGQLAKIPGIGFNARDAVLFRTVDLAVKCGPNLRSGHIAPGRYPYRQADGRFGAGVIAGDFIGAVGQHLHGPVLQARFILPSGNVARVRVLVAPPQRG